MEMRDDKKDDDASILESFRVCREEIHHEYEILGSRLNSYITSQAFLVSGYAMSMGNLNPRTGPEFRLVFPILLSVVGTLLSLRALPGISGACTVLSKWHDRQSELFEKESGLDNYQVLRQTNVKEIHERNLWFASTSPWIFMAAWILMAGLAIYLQAA
jgi:hypothetical protein